MREQEVVDYNRIAWDHLAKNNNEWTQPVSPAIIQRARQGDWEIILTPEKPVPKKWFPEIQNANILCLAGGGGQQAPLLAAAGANAPVPPACRA